MVRVAAQMWAPEYKENILEAGDVFGVENEYEDFLLALGEQGFGEQDDVQQQATHLRELARAALEAMVSSAIAWAVPRDDIWIEMAQLKWIDCFFDGWHTVSERMKELAPDGLPILAD
jgi:hypothetical protein